MSTSHSGTHHISLFVPELLSGIQLLKDLPKSDVPKLPALQLLLTRAIKSKHGFSDFYQGVTNLTGIQSQQHELPLAAITVAVDKKLNCETNSDYFIFAEPVVMKADRDTVVLLESLKPTLSENSLTLEDSEKLISEINQHFNDEPWHLNITNQGDWYLILNSNTAIQTTNIAAVLYNNAQAHLPKGDDARYWRKIINEIEMLLFSSSVNEARVKENKPAVISLWLWGGGVIPGTENLNSSFELWSGDDNSFLKSLALFLNYQYNSLNSQSISELIVSCESENIVIVDTALELCWQRRDLFAWLEALKQLELNLFKPLLLLLRKGVIDTVDLYPDAEKHFTLSQRSIKHWWKPVKSFMALASVL